MAKFRVIFEDDSTPPSSAEVIISGIEMSDADANALAEFFTAEGIGDIGQMSGPSVVSIAQIDHERPIAVI